MSYRNRAVVLRERAGGIPQPHHFALVEFDRPEPSENEVLVQNRYLSIDPAMRGWINDTHGYLPPVAINHVMRSLAVAEVLVSCSPDYREGDIVAGWFGWQDYAVVTAKDIIRKVNPSKEGSMTASLGVLGLNGITAYLALSSIGRPVAGETLLVSTAAGAVGSIVGQIAKLMGCHTVGLTGSHEKVAKCKEEFRYDAAINYKSCGRLTLAIGEVASGGIDIFFDNTAGTIADSVFPLLNVNGRVIQCGTSSVANWNPPPSAPRRERFFISKRLLQQGFVIFDHMDKWPATIDTLTAWIKEGKLNFREEVHHGIAKAPSALARLYSGTNVGKVIVEV